jgi:hypothetical protein
MHKEVGRNDPCPCGSGKKYKKCHGALPQDAAPKSKFNARVLPSGSSPLPTPAPIAPLTTRKITMLSQKEPLFEMTSTDYRPPGKLPRLPKPFAPKEIPPALEKRPFEEEAEFEMTDRDYRISNKD